MLLFEIISLANNSDSLIGALVYIDAYTGNQVRVLRVIQTNEGELVI